MLKTKPSPSGVPGPTVRLPSGPEYKGYIVLEEQLENIINNSASTYFQCASTALGVFFTAFSSLLSIGDIFPSHLRFFVILTVVACLSGFLTLVFGALWLKDRKRIHEEIRLIRSQHSADQIRSGPLITSNDLIAAGYKPGPAFKELLTAVEDAQLDGSISTKAEALELVRERARELA